MIDYESLIFDAIRTKFRTVYTEQQVTMASEYIKEPAQLPFVSIEQIDNYSVQKAMDTENENLAIVSFDINVYTNNRTGKKRLAKEIMAVLDDIMISLNFIRVQLHPTPDFLDATVYRIMGRYRVAIDKDGKLYRR